MKFFSVSAALLALALCQVVCGGLMTLTVNQKQQLLDKHNALRAKIANGEEPGQASAADLTVMQWDDQLAQKAGEWAQQCIIGHDSNSARLIGSYANVGQNCAYGYSDLVSGVQAWYDEVHDYDYASDSCSKVCGHYTQVVARRSLYIGCAAADCGAPYHIHLVCNYGPAGNFNGEKPFAAGVGASQCPGKFTLNQDGLCTLPENCQGANCECSVKPSDCQNGGVFNSDLCDCDCSNGFYGVKCDKVCRDSFGHCQYNLDMKNTQAEKDSWCAYFGPTHCAATCNMCVTEGAITDALNKDNIIARVP